MPGRARQIGDPNRALVRGRLATQIASTPGSESRPRPDQNCVHARIRSATHKLNPGAALIDDQHCGPTRGRSVTQRNARLRESASETRNKSRQRVRAETTPPSQIGDHATESERRPRHRVRAETTPPSQIGDQVSSSEDSTGFSASETRITSRRTGMTSSPVRALDTKIDTPRSANACLQRSSS